MEDPPQGPALGLEPSLPARAPAVAGIFYPAHREELHRTVASLLAAARPSAPAPKAIIAPHAGYIYSGSVAATAYACLALHVRRIVLLGPAHRVPVPGLAVYPASRFATPLGEIEIDAEAAERALRLPQVRLARAPHVYEHSLEVQLPFLQLCLPEARPLPLLVGDASAEQVAEVLDLLWGGEETAIVVSSDLSHYHDYDTANAIDERTSRNILRLRGQEIGPGQACGYQPIRGLLQACATRRLQARLLERCNSGDTAGDRQRVVGYGAYAFASTTP